MDLLQRRPAAHLRKRRKERHNTTHQTESPRMDVGAGEPGQPDARPYGCKLQLSAKKLSECTEKHGVLWEGM